MHEIFIKTDITDEDISKFLDDHIGFDTKEPCPNCGELLTACRIGIKWCQCGWSNEEDVSEFIKSLGVLNADNI